MPDKFFTHLLHVCVCVHTVSANVPRGHLAVKTKTRQRFLLNELRGECERREGRKRLRWVRERDMEEGRQESVCERGRNKKERVGEREQERKGDR